MRYCIWLWIVLGVLTTPALAREGRYYQVSESPFSSDIASKPGDLLTVNVWDIAKTEEDGKVKDSKNVSQLWNLVDFLFPKVPFTYNVNNSQNASSGSGGGTGVQGNGPGVYWSGKNKWDASSDKSSSHRVVMTVQARIVEEVHPGQFLIRGFRTVVVHGKPKKLFVSGVVRKKDIQEDNSVMSDHLAESVVEIDGKAVSDLQPGWIYRVFDTLFF